MKIHIIRHTTVGVPQGTCYGQTDVPLKDTFEAEAEIVKQKLKGISYDAIFSSPLSRCTRLAKYCGYENEIQLYDRLKELHFGDWEMQNWNELDMSEWENDWINTPAPNGESFKDMLDRVGSFFEEIKEKDYKEVIVFAHGGVINCARIYFGETELEHAFDKLAEYGEVLQFELR